MGIFDKLKNVFFEEEEVEEDETKEIMRTPVAKKIDVSESNKKEEKHEEIKEKKTDNSFNTLNLDSKEEPVERDFKFPMGFDDKDFEVEKTIEIFGPVKEEKVEIVSEVEPEEEVISDLPPVETTYTVETEETHEEIQYSEPVYEQPKIESRELYHKLYEGKEKEKEEEKPGFTPSPIISPIYGILNKNYKKEQIVTKSELKKNEVATKKDDLDIVREKAYGDLAGEISASIEDELIDIDEGKHKEKEDLLYDLNEEESPTVKTVTVGDAEEYFNDLGLEYNVDYKVEKNEEQKKKIEEEPKREKRVSKVDNLDSDDKNLFDLIDSMYEDEER